MMFVQWILAVTLVSTGSTYSYAAAAQLPFKVLHVADLVSLMKSNSPSPRIFDVNVESTRNHVGIIPGAKLLTSSSQFDPQTELPADKDTALVFYCANTQCTASHSAAKRAIHLGYKNVSVMVDGIYGWRKAGEPLEPVSKTPVPLEPKAVSELTALNTAIIVDVREDEERHEIIKNSQWMPMSQAQNTQAWSRFEASLPKGKTVVFHCAAGVRAKRAAEMLAADGYKTSYFQGPDQWRTAGLPLEKGPAQ